MILLVSGILDIIASMIVLTNLTNILVIAFGIVILIKGISSVAFNLLNGFIMDVFGYSDIVIGIIIIYGLGLGWIWIFPLVKGLYHIYRHLRG